MHHLCCIFRQFQASRKPLSHPYTAYTAPFTSGCTAHPTKTNFCLIRRFSQPVHVSGKDGQVTTHKRLSVKIYQQFWVNFPNTTMSIRRGNNFLWMFFSAIQILIKKKNKSRRVINKQLSYLCVQRLLRGLRIAKGQICRYSYWKPWWRRRTEKCRQISSPGEEYLEEHRGRKSRSGVRGKRWGEVCTALDATVWTVCTLWRHHRKAHPEPLSARVKQTLTLVTQVQLTGRCKLFHLNELDGELGYLYLLCALLFF